MSEITSAHVVTEPETGRSQGFGLVEMDVDDVNDVIRAVDGRELDGRPVRVNEADAKGGCGGGGGKRPT